MVRALDRSGWVRPRNAVEDTDWSVTKKCKVVLSIVQSSSRENKSIIRPLLLFCLLYTQTYTKIDKCFARDEILWVHVPLFSKIGSSTLIFYW